MKATKYLLIVALFGFALMTSCTPESIEDDQTEQQIERKDIDIPLNG
ncbi:MAG: hypothetical protein ABJM06_07325 [Gilvibacter sp.]